MTTKHSDSEFFDEEQSIRVIRKMISVSQHRLKSDGILFIIWGWLFFVGYLFEYLSPKFVMTYRTDQIINIAGLVLAVMILFLLWRLLRWLFSKSPVRKREKPSFNWIFELLTEVLRLMHRCNLRLGLKPGKLMAIDLYGKLLKWGTHSGLPRMTSETPNEYGSRLGRRFPYLEKEIKGVVGALNREVYGQMILDDGQLTAVRSSWGRLRSPLHWPARIRVRILNHGNV